MYTLASAAVLAADLVRHPQAARLADTLDRVLALTPEEVARLRDPAPDQVRRQGLSAAARCPRVSEDLDREGQTPARLLTRLESALLGDLADLHALVLREQPLSALRPEQQQVALDALTVAWAGAELPRGAAAALVAPWVAALSPIPPALPVRPWSAQLRALLDEVPRRSPAQWSVSARWQRAHHPPLSWSRALHEASTLAWGTGRVHDVARAQLAAARALAFAHTGVSPYASARVVTAAVQAACTADLLPADVHEALVGAWEAGRHAG